MPVVLLARRRPRSPLRSEARPVVPRRRPGPGPADRHHLDQGGPSSAANISRCYVAVAAAGKRADGIARRLLTEVVRPLLKGCHAADPRPGRHPDEAVRASRPGGRRASQPDPRPGRLALRLWARLRRPGPARGPPGVGRRRPAAAGPALRPQDEPAGHRPEAPAGVPHQAGAGRRVAPVGEALAGAPGVADLGGGRRGLCQWGVPQAGDGDGHDGRQPAPQGRGAADVARPPAGGQAGPATDLRGRT